MLLPIHHLLCSISDGEACQNLSGEGMELNVMYGVDEMSCSNRWMDKWNIIVTKDGQAGMNWEHSLLDGKLGSYYCFNILPINMIAFCS